MVKMFEIISEYSEVIIIICYILLIILTGFYVFFTYRLVKTTKESTKNAQKAIKGQMEIAYSAAIASREAAEAAKSEVIELRRHSSILVNPYLSLRFS